MRGRSLGDQASVRGGRLSVDARYHIRTLLLSVVIRATGMAQRSQSSTESAGHPCDWDTTASTNQHVAAFGQ